MAAKKLNVNQVLIRLIELMIRRRPEEITFAFAARHCKIPRSTLYYYFGNSRMNMLNEAIKYGMQVYVQLPQIERYRKFKTWEAFEMNRMETSLRRSLRYPWASELFFKFRNDKTELGETIRRIEGEYGMGMGKAWAYFHGKPPRPEAMRFIAYLKVGMFFGFAADQAIWKSPEARTRRKSYLRQFEKFVMELQHS